MQIAQLQWMLGKKKTEADLKEAVEFSQRKVDCALAIVGQARTVQAGWTVLGGARSNVSVTAVRQDDWVIGRTTETFNQPADSILVDAVWAGITALSTYG